jgi:hypothetical protein
MARTKKFCGREKFSSSHRKAQQAAAAQKAKRSKSFDKIANQKKVKTFHFYAFYAPFARIVAKRRARSGFIVITKWLH